MNIETLQIFLAGAVILAALSVGVVCAVGVMVWLAGGKFDEEKWHPLA